MEKGQSPKSSQLGLLSSSPCYPDLLFYASDATSNILQVCPGCAGGSARARAVRPRLRASFAFAFVSSSRFSARRAKTLS